MLLADNKQRSDEDFLKKNSTQRKLTRGVSMQPSWFLFLKKRVEVIKDFKLICFIGSLYEILAKVLVWIQKGDCQGGV